MLSAALPSGAVAARLNYLMETSSVFRFLLGRRSRYEVYHVFGNVRVTSAAIAFAKVFGVPVLVEMTSDRSNPHGSHPWVVRRLLGERLPANARIVCISEKLRRMCEDQGYRENVWCRPNPVDETRFFPEPDRRSEFRRKHTPFQDSDVLLSYVGKFMPTKNQLFLIEVLRHLPEGYKLVLGGPLAASGPFSERDGRYLESLRRAIDEHRLEGRVKVVPEFIEHPEEYMKSSDVYVFPSTSEGLGTPVLEAIACGVPVVANRIEGVTDQWIEEGQSGFLAALNPGEFANKVIQATQISTDTLLSKSQGILSVASSQAIDRQYWESLQELSGQSEREGA